MQVVRNKRHLVNNDARRSGRRPRRRRGRKQSRGAIYGNAVSQLGRDVRYLMSIINVEDKYIDISASVSATASAWAFVILNTMVRGTSPTTRIGQSVKAVGTELRWSLVMNASGQVPQFFRIVMFVDHQPNAANATLTDIYPADILSPRNVGYLPRFTILYERVIAMNPDSNECFCGDFIRKLNWHEEFNTGNAGDITDITKNSLYLMWFTDRTTNLPTFNYNNRYVFVDN